METIIDLETTPARLALIIPIKHQQRMPAQILTSLESPA